MQSTESPRKFKSIFASQSSSTDEMINSGDESKQTDGYGTMNIQDKGVIDEERPTQTGQTSASGLARTQPLQSSTQAETRFTTTNSD